MRPDSVLMSTMPSDVELMRPMVHGVEETEKFDECEENRLGAQKSGALCGRVLHFLLGILWYSLVFTSRMPSTPDLSILSFLAVC